MAECTRLLRSKTIARIGSKLRFGARAVDQKSRLPTRRREVPVTRESLRECAAVQRARHLQAISRAEKSRPVDGVVAVTGIQSHASPCPPGANGPRGPDRPIRGADGPLGAPPLPAQFRSDVMLLPRDVSGSTHPRPEALEVMRSHTFTSGTHHGICPAPHPGRVGEPWADCPDQAPRSYRD